MESERKYRLLAENVSDTIWILNLKTLTFDYISPSVEKIRGYTPEEARALPLDQTLSPSSLAKVSEMLEVELTHDGLPGIDHQRFRTIEIENSIKNGGFVWAEATVSFIRDGSGAPTAILGVTRDISERKQVETRIAESEEKYRILFENGSDLLCIHDLEGYLKVRDRAGRKVILEYRNRLIRDARGVPRAVQGAARDVTQRIAYEKALKESEEKNKAIVQHAPAGIFEGDMEHGRFISANDVMSGYTGYALDELMRMDPFFLFSPESAERAKKLLERANPGDRNLPPAEFMLRDKDGKERPVLANTLFFYEKRSASQGHDGAP